ncbi:MAG: PIG-L family deacetylase [Chloroflexota bacterium]
MTGSGPKGGLLLIHAHPDDEVMSTGGTIARAVAEGRRVDLMVCTGGEEGEIHDPDLDPAEAQPRLREIREAELRCSLAALGAAAADSGGVLQEHLLGFRDSGMMGTSPNDHPDSFWRVDLDTVVAGTVAFIRTVRPSVLVHYDEHGGYGHPDHIQAHRLAVAACEAAADPDRYPEAGPPHRIRKRYETAFSRERWLGLMVAMNARGIDLPWNFEDEVVRLAAGREFDQLYPADVEALRQVGEALAEGEPAEGFGTSESQLSTRVDVTGWLDAKRAAMACHRTQRQDLGWALELPEDLQAAALGLEVYVLREWDGARPRDELAETSLFAGV